MKAIKYLSILALTLFAATSCMNDFDEPDFKVPPFGNNEIGDANTTIAELKAEYATIISGSSVEEITDDIIIEGVVVGNDITGNIYKQFIIDDGTGAIVVGVNDVGLYAIMARGQKVVIDCKGLHIGGYGKSAQIGSLYEGKVGRMPKAKFPQHVKLVDKPGEYTIEPEVVDNSFFTDANKENLPKYVRLENITIAEANGTKIWVPEEEVAFSNTVKRNVKMGNTNVIFLVSTYADFANEVMPAGALNATGVLTRYNNDWQFNFSTTDDIQPVVTE